MKAQTDRRSMAGSSEANVSEAEPYTSGIHFRNATGLLYGRMLASEGFWLVARLIGTILALSIVGIGQTVAQVPPPDPDAGQIVSLFEQSCMRFAGDPAGLRSWISAHHLPQVPPEQAALFLGPIGTGEVFGASTPSGKHALVSYDSGACQVIAMAGYASTVQRMLLALLGRLGVSVSQVLVRSKPDGSSTQHLFDATLGARHWKISITSKPHADTPKLAPTILLLATVG